MPKKRKLQVFVSSTFTDLKEERQATVEAILNTGHIPAGMELFAGKNEDQMNIIKEWIEESDIYMLLLGGRYGSVDPKSGKSYTHLEYEHAQSLGKPVFVVVASDSYINQKITANGKPDGIIELEYRKEYTSFKNDITGRYVKFWDNQDQLQLAVTNTLHILERDDSLIGWVPGNEVAITGAIAEQLARLSKENIELRHQLSIAQMSTDPIRYNGLTYDQMYSLINNAPMYGTLEEHDEAPLQIIASVFGDVSISLVHVFYYLDASPSQDRSVSIVSNGLHWPMQELIKIGLIIVNNESSARQRYGTELPESTFRLTTTGHQFLLRIKIEKDIFRLNNLLSDYYEHNSVG